MSLTDEFIRKVPSNERGDARKYVATRATSKEAVLAIYISIELGVRIKSLSKFARIAVEKDNLYIVGGRWGSSKRVEFAGGE